jgi:alpha-galactosidase
MNQSCPSSPGLVSKAYSPDYAKDHILTPPVSPLPRINGATVFGARPGNPFHFRIAASGQKPLSFFAPQLPKGIHLDQKTGVLSGVMDAPDKFSIKVCVSNVLGQSEKIIRIVIGEDLALTPPMGWNSWYCLSESVSQRNISEVAEAFIKTGLAEHGWNYVNIDDCWQGIRGGDHHAIQGNHRFPDMKQMCDDVHALGLKVGIYSTPWISSYAGFIGGSSDTSTGIDEQFTLPPEMRNQQDQLYGRYPSFLDLKLDRVGQYWLCDADAKQWANWGIDFVKYDWKPNDIPTTQRIYEGLRHCGRDIVLSLSNEAPIENAQALSCLANLWRTTWDIQEDWRSVEKIAFSQERWQSYQRPGHWNDMDMLQIGMIGQPNNKNTSFHRTSLTPDEQYSQFSMWSLLSAPLLLSSDLTQIDHFTLSLLTNDEVIEVNQDPLGLPAKKISGKEIWVKPLEDGSLAVGIFNRGDDSEDITVSLSELGLSGNLMVRDLWRQVDLGRHDQFFTLSVSSHGVRLVRVFDEHASI